MNGHPSARQMRARPSFANTRSAWAAPYLSLVPSPMNTTTRPAVVVHSNALALACAAHEACWVAKRKGHAIAAVLDRVVVLCDGHVVDAERSEIRLDVETQAVADDLDKCVALPGCGQEPGESLVLWHCGGLATQQVRVARQDIHVPLHELARTDLARVIERVQTIEFGAVVVVTAK